MYLIKKQSKVTEKMIDKNERVVWIDIAKGIAILLVILGHTLSWNLPAEKTLRDAIYSYHMPLFFVLCAAASKPISNANELVKKIELSFIKLIFPLIGYAILLILFEAAISIELNNFDMSDIVSKGINSLVYANGVDVHVQNAIIPAIGIVWFMITLFLSKTLFGYICFKLQSPKKQFVVSIMCGVLGMIIGHFQWLPFTLDIVLQVMPFFYLGNLIKQFKLQDRTIIKMLICGIIWFAIFMFYYTYANSGYDLSWRWHPLYPLSDIGAMFGVLFIIYLSVWLQKFKLITPLKFLGRNTFLLFWIHTFDSSWQFFWMVTNHVSIHFSLRLLEDILVFYIIYELLCVIKERVRMKKSQ